MKQKLLLVLLLVCSMLFLGNTGCDPPKLQPVDQFNPDLEYGEMTDERDGQTYKTIEIGTQTWMAENMNYNTHYPGNSWCYNYVPANCEVYGRLYDWKTALTVCPSGWRLPGDADWTTLTDYLGGESVAGGKMKSTSSLWQGPNIDATNESGWSGLPGGYRRYNGGSYFLDNYGNWWSASESTADDAWYRYLHYSNGDVARRGYDKVSGFSVRCLKDDH